jgi:hypothetical protein
MDYEVMLRVNELSEIIRLHRHAEGKLKRFRESYPYLIAPNVLSLLEENLRDNMQVLNKEMQQLQAGKQGPVGDQSRYVCKRCHQKFTAVLPDGLCDQCRAREA